MSLASGANSNIASLDLCLCAVVVILSCAFDHIEKLSLVFMCVEADSAAGLKHQFTDDELSATRKVLMYIKKRRVKCHTKHRKYQGRSTFKTKKLFIMANLLFLAGLLI